MHLIVTRPRAQAEGWVRELQALGQTASALPLIEIASLDDPAPLRQAWLQLDRRALVMFVSANAVLHFFAAAPPGRRWPGGVLAGSTGPGTSAALRAAGVPAALLVQPDASEQPYDSEALWARLAGHDWAGRSVLVVRGEDGRDWLAETLRSRGATVDFVAAYRRRPPALGVGEQHLLQQALQAPHAHLWLFSSSEAVGHLRALAPAADWSRSAAVASHPRIAQAAQAAGFGRVERALPSAAAVAALVRSWTGQVAPIESRPQ